MIDALALERFIDGREPGSRTTNLQRVRPDAPLLPPGVDPTRTAVASYSRVHLARDTGWTLTATRWRDGSASVVVTAVNELVGQDILNLATKDAELPPPPADEATTVGFWYLTCKGAKRRTRAIDVTPWADLRRNYNEHAAAAMDRLMGRDQSTLSGKLLLLHGPPGTGKTTALRSLAHAWRDWCDVEHVLDPERLMKESAYLMGVALGEDRDDDDEDVDRWRLVILEDCDELIRPTAKEGEGQNLARLLNVTDGLPGHGLKLLVAITTNEPLSRLHPAVTRPGRCVAEIEVGRLSPAEARRWLGRSMTLPSEGVTLAELYAIERGVGLPPPTAVGQYL